MTLIQLQLLGKFVNYSAFCTYCTFQDTCTCIVVVHPDLTRGVIYQYKWQSNSPCKAPNCWRPAVGDVHLCVQLKNNHEQDIRVWTRKYTPPRISRYKGPRSLTTSLLRHHITSGAHQKKPGRGQELFECRQIGLLHEEVYMLDWLQEQGDWIFHQCIKSPGEWSID